MNDDPRMRAARSWLIDRHYTDESAEQLAPQMLAELDAADPLRQARGDTRPPPSVKAAIEDIRSHVGSWTILLTRYVDMLDEETDECDRLYAEHELRAMERDLTALIAAVDLLPKARGDAVEVSVPPFPAWSPEMAELVKAIAASWRDTHLSKRGDDLYSAAFPDPAREGSPDVQ